MSNPSPAPRRPDADHNDPPASREEIDVVNGRDQVYPEQRRAARPANEVMERLLRRYPAP